MAHFEMSLINLNHPAHYFGIGPFQISVGNAVVIGIMFGIFMLALLVKFPSESHDHDGGEKR